MTTSLKTYPKYKESSLEWTAGIPSDWEKRRFKFIFNLVKRPIGIDDEIITAFRDGAVTLRRNRKEDGFTIALKEIGYQGVRRGDLVISGMDGFAGAIGISDSDGKATPVYSVCQPIQKSVFPGYYKYLLRVLALSGYISILARGIRERSTEFKWNIIGNLLLVVPDFETQKSIAIFLDERTKAIDELVAKKEELIVLLSEKRTSLINRFISLAKGKPSKIKACSTLSPGKEKVQNLKRNDVVSFVPMEALSETGELDPQERMYQEVQTGFTYFENDDVVLAKITPCFENGKAGVMKSLKDGFGFGTTEFIVLRPNVKILPEYLYFIVFSDKFRKSGEVEMRGTAGQKRVTNLYVRNYEFILPSVEEQRVIVKNINTEIQGMLDIVEKATFQIGLLKEYRSSLIYSAVTGKIKI
jgi:type I restriction enzyme S subunit